MFTQSVSRKHGKSDSPVSSLFKPVQVKTNTDNANVGVELTGSLSKRGIIQALCNFANKDSIKQLSVQYGLDGNYSFIHFL